MQCQDGVWCRHWGDASATSRTMVPSSSWMLECMRGASSQVSHSACIKIPSVCFTCCQPDLIHTSCCNNCSSLFVSVSRWQAPSTCLVFEFETLCYRWVQKRMEANGQTSFTHAHTKLTEFFAHCKKKSQQGAEVLQVTASPAAQSSQVTLPYHVLVP